MLITFLNQTNEPSNLNLFLMKQTLCKDAGVISNNHIWTWILKGHLPNVSYSMSGQVQEVKGVVIYFRLRTGISHLL